MSLETATYIDGLNSSNPDAADVIGQGDDHLRLIKGTIKATFPNITGAVTPTHTELNYVDGVSSAIQTQMDLKAPLASPTFTGTVVLPSTTSIGTVSSTEIGYVDGVTSAIQTQLDAKLAITTAGRWTHLQTLTGSGTGSLDSSASFASYSSLMVEFLSVVPSSTNVEFWLRTSTDSAVSFDAGASDYTTVIGAIDSGGGTLSSAGKGASTKVTLTGSGYAVGSSGSVSGVLYLYLPAAATPGYMTWQVSFYQHATAALVMANGAGRREASADITNLRFLFQTGNITSGYIRIYGR